MLIKKKNLISKGIISRTHLIVLLMMLMSIFVSCAKLTNDDGGEKIDKTGIKVIEGRVVDGPISGATVYLDINKNGEMDNNEPKQLSDGDGYFRFEADVPTGTVVISQGGVDTVTGEAVEELIGETLGGEFVYISPLTTVLQGVEASKDKTREENRKELLEALGIDFSESEVFTKNTYKMATKEGSESEEDERKKAEKVEKLGMQLTLMIKTAQMVAEIDAGEVSQKEVVKALLGALIEEKKSTKDMQLENKELVKNVLKKVKETVDEKAGMSNPSNNDSKINTIAEGVANGNGALNLSNFKEISEKSSETKKIINDAFQLDQQVKEFLGGTITKEKFEEDIKILIVGCMNSLACNYNEQASIDSGSCEIPVGCNSCSGERDGTGVIVNNDADNDGVCDDNDVCDSYANSDATALPTWYEDEDGDGYYSNSSEVCESPGINWNLTAISGNDVCPLNADSTTVVALWYEDSDGDGLGNGNVSESICTQPSGYVSNTDDSDDACTNNSYQNWYVDSDEDGYGTGSATSVCTDTDSVAGKVTNNSDACDSYANGDASALPTWYEDADGDGYYSTTSMGCESPGSAWRLLVKPGNRAELVAKLNETVPDESNTYYNGNSAATCGDINTWDTSLITNMSFLFQHKSSFNCDISNWDVSNVTNMSHMFRDNYGTSIPIGSWDVSNVVHMTMMFAYSRFNHDISNWNTSKVVQMQGMFQGNTVFNQPLNDWDVSNVTNMCWMFAFNSSFNQPLNDWDVSNVDLMCHMFQEASAFNQPLNNWDVSNVTQIQNIFAWSYAYDQDLSSWDTSKIRSGYFGGFGDQAGFSSTNKCKIHDAFKSNPAWLEDSSQNPWCN